MTVTAVSELDDRAVLLAIQYLAEDLRAELPVVVRTPAEARVVVSALLAQGGIADLEPDQLLSVEDDALPAARRALAAADTDPGTHERVEQLLADPPQDEQMGIESAVGSVAVLAFLISWLQTKVELRIHRKDGKTEIEFTVSREAADSRVLRDFADVFRGVLGIPSPPTSGPKSTPTSIEAGPAVGDEDVDAKQPAE